MIEMKLVERLMTVAENVYPLSAPLDYKRPAVIYNRIDTDTVDDLDEWDGEDSDSFVTFQIDVYSTNFMEAKTLARKIKKNMKLWRDEDARVTAIMDEKTMDDNTSQTALFRVMAVYKVFCTD
jgi:hypothetical protein